MSLYERAKVVGRGGVVEDMKPRGWGSVEGTSIEESR